MKKLLLTLMCIVAAAIPAFADVTYEPVALSDINSGDEVVMVGSNGGKLYFATPTIDSSSYLTCLAVTGDVSERVTLTDDQNGQIQKFIITTDGSTVSLKKNDADEYLAFEGTNGGLSWGAETQFTTTNSTKEGGGIYLVGSKPAIGFFPGTFNIFFAGGAVANSCNGIHFFKEVKADAPVKQSVYLALSTSLLTLQMEEGKTVTGQLPTITAYLNYYDDNAREVVTDVDYTYTAVKSNDSDEATDVISVDENGVVTALKAGDVYVKVEIKSDKYKADPVYVNVLVKEPVVEHKYTGTTFTAGATSSFYLAISSSWRTPQFTLSNGETDTRSLAAGYYYIFPAKSRSLTKVVIDGEEKTLSDYDSYFGANYYFFTVTAGKEPRSIEVTTTEAPTEPVPTGTKFVISGGGTVEIWYQNSLYKPVYFTTLEPDADGVAYVELPDNEGRNYYIAASEKSLLTSVAYGGYTYTGYYLYDGAYAGLPSNYCFFNNANLEYEVTCIPNNVTTITFEIPTTDRAILKDSEGNNLGTLGNYATETKKLTPGETYYICNQTHYELKSVTSSTGESLTIEQTANGQQAAFTVGEEKVTYTISCIALPKEPAKFIFPNGRNVSIYTYNTPHTLEVNFEMKEDNTFDFDEASANIYYIVANEGYKLTSVDVDPIPSTTQSINTSDVTMANGFVAYSWCYMYKSWDPVSVTVNVEKVARVEFEVAEGSKAVLMHNDGNNWITDHKFEANTEDINTRLSLDFNTNYYIFAIDDYKLTEVLGDGEGMTIEPCDESMPYATTYAMFNSDEAPSTISITAIEDKPEINPGDLASGQMVTFDFCENTARLDLSNAKKGTSDNNLYFSPGATMIGDGGAVMLEFGGNRTAIYVPNGYLGINSGKLTAAATTCTMTVKFTDATSYLEKIVFEFADGSQYFASWSTGTLLGTVWEPSTAASAPGMNVVKAGNEVKSVTFTPTVATSNWLTNEVRIRKMMVTYTGAELPTRIETVEASAEDVEAVYYNLQGVRVENPAAGIYVRVRGNQVDKVLVK